MAPRANPPPADSANDGTDRPQPTPAEAYLFFTMIKHMNSKPDINWDAVAVDNGFKNAETAKVRFGQIKRKLGLGNWGEGGGSGATTSSPRTPRAPRAKKATATTASSPPTASEGVSDIVDDALAPSSSGVKKARTKRAVRPKIEDHASDALVAAAKKAPRKSSAVKKEETTNTEDLSNDAPVGELDDNMPMEMDDEHPIGRITPAQNHHQGHSPAAVKDDPEDDDIQMLSSTPTAPTFTITASTTHGTATYPAHPGFTTAGLAPIPGTAGSFRQAVHTMADNTNQQGRSHFFGMHSAGPVKERDWLSDDDSGTIEQKEPSTSTSSMRRNAPSHMTIEGAIPVADLSSMMTGSLPGGAIYGSGGLNSQQQRHSTGHGSSHQGQGQGGWDMPDVDIDSFDHGGSIFGSGRAGGRGGGRGGYGGPPGGQ